MFSTSQFYSPEDQLNEEKARLAPSRADQDIHKRKRLFYEGEPDTTKWAIQPPKDILTGADEGHQPDAVSIPVPLAKEEPVDPVVQEPSVSAELLQLSSEVLQQVANLCSAQNDFERRLFEHRRRIQYEHEKALKQMKAREIIGPVPEKEMEELLRQQRLELDRADRRTVEKMDELRYQQQIQLQSLGIPGFCPSSNTSVMLKQRSTLRQIMDMIKTQ
ncbi:hypothetical protein H4R99_002903 [Coemansia sp. RSA 1722]|nr:hypothetical protein LPJ57_007560 [Coemansia sp. RSA 486]KAJ2234420.1 hypothetical protein IWW45_003424 [Coemansia sp. RSA 485]KAJ2601748.1 hypothetical protein H4R99_002903 [Coemansia sp. RSA 1722]